MRKSPVRLAAAMSGALLFAAAPAHADPRPAHPAGHPSASKPHDRHGDKPGSRSPDPGARRVIAGGPTSDDVAQGAGDAELAIAEGGGARALSARLARARAPRVARRTCRCSCRGTTRPTCTRPACPPSQPTAPPAPDGAQGSLRCGSRSSTCRTCRCAGTTASCATWSSSATTRAATRRSCGSCSTRVGTAT